MRRRHGPHGDAGPAIGGLARNQYLEAPKLLSPRWWEINEAAAWTAAAPPPGEAADETYLPIRFDKGSTALSDDAAATLQRAAGAIDSKYGTVSLEIASYAADGGSEKRQRELSTKRANTVKTALQGALPSLRDRHFHLLAGADAPALAAAPAAEEGGLVAVRVFKIILPGEHGFHFFPGYYRHLFDTMRRTPVLDDQGRETGRSVYDRLAVAPHQSYAVQFPHSRTTDETLDYLQFSMRIHRYLTTCPARRAAEYEDVSWWQYLTGWNPLTRTPLYVYSPQFAQGVKFSGRVLAAFDAEWGDARTNGDTFIQLELQSWTGHPTFDGILNGGETECWFDPWRRYLTSRGVEFVSAKLEGFELVEGKLGAMVVPAGQQSAVLDQDADYYVSATDVVAAEKVTSRLPRIGVPASLSGYTTIVPPCPLSQAESASPHGRQATVRDPLQQPGLHDWDRLQTLSGIQYFFTNKFDLVDGYMYFTDAVWALSSINPQQFWTHRPTLEKDGYIGLMSVDIGNWKVASKTPALLGKSAWECTREEIAQEVWRQVTTSLLREAPDLLLPQPVWYNLDQNIVFGDPPAGTPRENLTPYQIPIVGDWKHRPVGNPWDPTPTLPNLDGCYPHLDAGLWQARHGGYLVHWDKLVFAGTYMRTFTRMTTMESANESAPTRSTRSSTTWWRSAITRRSSSGSRRRRRTRLLPARSSTATSRATSRARARSATTAASGTRKRTSSPACGGSAITTPCASRSACRTSTTRWASSCRCPRRATSARSPTAGGIPPPTPRRPIPPRSPRRPPPPPPPCRRRRRSSNRSRRSARSSKRTCRPSRGTTTSRKPTDHRLTPRKRISCRPPPARRLPPTTRSSSCSPICPTWSRT